MSQNGFRRGTQRNKPLSLGACCVCEGTAEVVNIMLLNGLCPSEGKGWACLQCGLSPNGAIAVVCEGCRTQVEAGVAKVRFICSGYPASPGRLPIALMTGSHEHDMTKHVGDEGGF